MVTLERIHEHFARITVSGMAKWLRRSLAKWKVPGLNLTMGKVLEKVSVKKSFGKKNQKKQKKKNKKKQNKKKKPASYPLLA